MRYCRLIILLPVLLIPACGGREDAAASATKLLQLDANRQLMDHKGLTALDWALQEQHAGVAGSLRGGFP